MPDLIDARFPGTVLVDVTNEKTATDRGDYWAIGRYEWRKDVPPVLRLLREALGMPEPATFSSGDAVCAKGQGTVMTVMKVEVIDGEEHIKVWDADHGIVYFPTACLEHA